MPTLPRALHRPRLLQVLGLLVAVLGLVGFWATRDAPRSDLGVQQRELLGVDDGEFHASFVVAGRDVHYGEGEADPILDDDGEIVGWDFQGETSVRGTNTDTILYVNVIGSTVTMVALPRDLFIDDGARKINGVLARQGADGLEREVESLLGVPVDYYAIIDLGIFQSVVDALGGVEVNVPERMYYRDVAAGLTIDFEPGPQRMDGEAASEFVRYRQFRRGDLDRLDNVKRLAYALLARVKELHVRAVGTVPELVSTFFEQVETNASPALARRLLPRLADLEIQAATLPTVEAAHGEVQGLEVAASDVERFLAETFGGETREYAQAPDAPLVITDRSGRDGLAEAYRARLTGLGVPADRIETREGSFDPGATRMVAVSEAWGAADFYTSLLGIGKQQVDALRPVEGRSVQLELILGGDATALATEGAMAAAPDEDAAP